MRAITSLHCELNDWGGDPTGLLYGRARARGVEPRARARGGSHAPQTHEDQTCGLVGPRAHEDQTLPSVQPGSGSHDLGWTGPEILNSISLSFLSLLCLALIHSLHNCIVCRTVARAGSL